MLTVTLKVSACQGIDDLATVWRNLSASAVAAAASVLASSTANFSLPPKRPHTSDLRNCESSKFPILLQDEVAGAMAMSVIDSLEKSTSISKVLTGWHRVRIDELPALRVRRRLPVEHAGEGIGAGHVFRDITGVLQPIAHQQAAMHGVGKYLGPPECASHQDSRSDCHAKRHVARLRVQPYRAGQHHRRHCAYCHCTVRGIGDHTAAEHARQENSTIPCSIVHLWGSDTARPVPTPAQRQDKRHGIRTLRQNPLALGLRAEAIRGTSPGG